MRPLPGAPGVAAAAALLLVLLPRARADEHEHTVRGAAARRPGRPAESAFRLGLGGGLSALPGPGSAAKGWASFPCPNLHGAASLGQGPGRPRANLREGSVGGPGTRLGPQGREQLSGCRGPRHSGRWMLHDYPSYTNQEITPSRSSLAVIFHSCPNRIKTLARGHP